MNADFFLPLQVSKDTRVNNNYLLLQRWLHVRPIVFSFLLASQLCVYHVILFSTTALLLPCGAFWRIIQGFCNFGRQLVQLVSLGHAFLYREIQKYKFIAPSAQATLQSLR